MSDSPAEWYFRNYPKAPHHQHRLLQVLSCWQALYNLPIKGQDRNDGGIRVWGGDGIMVRCQPGVSLGTFDDSALTRLVIAAHAYCCRVSIHVNKTALEITVHPRRSEGTRFFDRHPDLLDLMAQAEISLGDT